ncbi:hypothetical protein AAK882_09725 [Carnobacteriaceae bacterium 52-44]
MMIERYIYAETKELPKDNRKEISNELRRLISERMRRLDNTLSEEEKMMKVLTDLGDPKKLANQYRNKERYLIGPKYFEKYIMVMKIVMLSIFFGLSLVHGFSILFEVNSVLDMLGGYIGSLLSALMQGAAWVTGVFALLEYNEISLEHEEKEEPWNPNQLRAVPNEKARISRGESIFSIVFSTIFLTLFFFSPGAIGIYYFIGDNMNFIPLFNLQALAVFQILIFIVFTFDILIEMLKIIQGRWSRNLAIIVTALNILSALILIYALSNVAIWNEEITVRFEEFLTIPFDRLIIFTIIIIVMTTIVESVSALYKGIRYGNI